MLKIALGAATLSVRRWSSTDAAQSACPGLPILNGEVPPGEPVYELQVFSERRGAPVTKSVGIQMDDSQQSLTVLGTVFDSLIWLGCNAQVIALSLELDVKYSLSLDSRFSYFCLKMVANQLLVVAEAEVCAIAPGGELAWKQDFDLITSLEWAEGSLLVSQENGSVEAINTETGARQVTT